MKKLLLAEIVKATNAQVLSEKQKEFKGLGSDTRVDLNGQLFVALKGEQFDAHDFLKQALEKKATGFLVSEKEKVPAELLQKATVILVKDTLKALQDLAHFCRKKSPAAVIGLTGSNGKTTSKEFTAAVIGAEKKVHYSKGSFNNHWGVPFSILAEPEGSEVAILEMGMNHHGELTTLCQIAEPDIVVCSVVGRAHIEHFGSVESIAQAKEEIYQHSPQALQIFNLDNPWTLKMYERSKASRKLTFSEKKPADVSLQIAEMSMSKMKLMGSIAGQKGQAEVEVFGAQNLTNIMVAASCALAVGLKPEKIWQNLSRCKTNWGRNQLVHSKKGAEILFDGYNANPDSMAALIGNISLVKNTKKKIGVFAQMLELGDLSKNLHQELGEKVGQAGFDVVWFYGAEAEAFAAGIRSSGFKKTLIISKSYEDSLASEVASMLDQGDIALVKGSRGMKLERFVLACEPQDFSLDKNK